MCLWHVHNIIVFIGKFYGSFNNILNVLGHNRNEILAVHLVKTYCLPAAVYGGEVWSPTSSALKSLSVAWNNAFRRIFNTCWRESPRSLQFYCVCLPIAFLLDQRRLLFWKKMSISNNTKYCWGSSARHVRLNYSKHRPAKDNAYRQDIVTRICRYTRVNYNINGKYTKYFAQLCGRIFTFWNISTTH